MELSQTETIISLVTRSEETWRELKNHWLTLGLPGFSSSPTEFIAQLLIGYLGLEKEQVIELLARVKDTSLKELHSNEVLPRVASGVSEATAILALAVVLQRDAWLTEGVSLPVAIAANIKLEEKNNLVSFADSTTESNTSDNNKELAAPIADEEETENKKEISGNNGSCQHVDHSGKCVGCSSEETLDCDGCNSTLFTSKAHKCKNFEGCGYAYCDDCIDMNLSGNGYCDNCAVLACDECSGDVDAGSEKHCVNKSCHRKYDYCEGCAKQFLNQKGQCSDCSDEEDLDCTACFEENFEPSSYTESLLIKCRNYDGCGNAFCEDHTEEGLHAGLCESCREEDDDE